MFVMTASHPRLSLKQPTFSIDIRVQEGVQEKRRNKQKRDRMKRDREMPAQPHKTSHTVTAIKDIK